MTRLGFRCHTCGQVFTAWATVERHVDQAHGGGRIDCVTLDKAFKVEQARARIAAVLALSAPGEREAVTRHLTRAGVQ